MSQSFPCPKCDETRTRVIETRSEIRRRKCLACNCTFTTIEVEYDRQRNEYKSPTTIRKYEQRERQLNRKKKND